MDAADMILAAKRLGAEFGLDSKGPFFKLPDMAMLTAEQKEALSQLRRVMSRNRDVLIRHLGGNPEDYAWVPADGTEERKWYDHIVGCTKEKAGGVSVGQSDREWHHHRDAKRLLTSCRNTLEWKREAQAFWWDTTHAKSWKADDYEWPLLKE